MSKKPTRKFRLGLITATVWENDGFYSVDLARSYKDSEGQWQNATNYSHADLLNLSKLAQRAETWIEGQVNAPK